MTDYSEYLQTAVEAAKKTKEVVLKYFTGSIEVELKADQSPVTIADKEAESIIKSFISNKYPEHAFLGEESGKSISNSEYIWIVDPIDGTKNYMRGIPLFATQIALMKHNEVIIGLSYAPALNELVCACRGSGAFLNDRQIKVSNTNNLKSAYTSFGGLNHFIKHKRIHNLTSLINNILSARGFGDAWSYHLLAQGKIDIMVEGAMKIWDIAAVSLIVEEAGGKVTDLDGNKISLTTNSFLATNGILHDEVLKYFLGQ